MVRRSVQVEAVLDSLRTGCTYGLAIMRRTGLKSGTVYPILQRMEQAGWVRGTRDETPAAPGRPARRVYQLTGSAPALR